MFDMCSNCLLQKTFFFKFLFTFTNSFLLYSQEARRASQMTMRETPTKSDITAGLFKRKPLNTSRIANILELGSKQRTTTVRKKSRLISYLSDTYVIKISKSLFTGKQHLKWASTPFFLLLKLSVYNNVLIDFSNVSFKKGMFEGRLPGVLAARQKACLCNIFNRIFWEQSSSMVLKMGSRDPPRHPWSITRSVIFFPVRVVEITPIMRNKKMHNLSSHPTPQTHHHYSNRIIIHWI